MIDLARPLPVFRPAAAEPLPETWPPAPYLLTMRLFGLIPPGRQAVDSATEDGGFILTDNGQGALMRRWQHEIRVDPHPDGCLYRDCIDFDAGRLTVPAALALRFFPPPPTAFAAFGGQRLSCLAGRLKTFLPPAGKAV